MPAWSSGKWRHLKETNDILFVHMKCNSGFYSRPDQMVRNNNNNVRLWFLPYLASNKGISTSYDLNSKDAIQSESR